MLASWLAPLMFGVSLALLARAHYVLYVLRRGNRMSSVITWVATFLVIGFWVWRAISNWPA
jgi:hypothetical protein